MDDQFAPLDAHSAPPAPPLPPEPSPAPAPIELPPAEPEQIPSPQQRHMRMNMKRWIGLVVCIALIIPALALMQRLALPTEMSPAQVTDAFFNEAGSGDTVTAYNGTAEMFRKVGSQEKFDALVQAKPQLFTSKRTFPTWNISGDNADAHGTLTLADGTIVPIHVTLLKENGVWKVSGFSTGTDAK